MGSKSIAARNHLLINLVHFLGASSHTSAHLGATRFPVDLHYVKHCRCLVSFILYAVIFECMPRMLCRFRQGYVSFYKSGKVTFLRSYRCEFNITGNVTLQGFPLPDANKSLAASLTNSLLPLLYNDHYVCFTSILP